MSEFIAATAPPSTPARQKLWIYAALAAIFFANGALDQLYYWDKEFSPLDFLFGFTGLLLLFWWYRIDARERAFPPSRGLGMAILLLAIVGMPVYLFKSRGFAKGLVATCLFLLGLVATGAATYAGAYAAFVLFQQT